MIAYALRGYPLAQIVTVSCVLITPVQAVDIIVAAKLLRAPTPKRGGRTEAGFTGKQVGPRIKDKNN